jgi:hypothetical protein
MLPESAGILLTINSHALTPLEVGLYFYCLNFASYLNEQASCTEKHSDVRGGFIGPN